MWCRIGEKGLKAIQVEQTINHHCAMNEPLLLRITNFIWCSMSPNGADKRVLMQLLKCLDYLQYSRGSKIQTEGKKVWKESKQTEKLPKHHRHVVNDGSCPNKWFILIHLVFRRTFFFAIEFTSISFGLVGWCLLWQYIFHKISFWLVKYQQIHGQTKRLQILNEMLTNLCTTRYS